MRSFFWLCIVCVVAVRSTTLLFDGRIPIGTTPADFDQGLTPYNAGFVHGQNQTWAEIITTGDHPASVFDGDRFQSLALSLTDASVFAPNPTFIQTGFRRSELLPRSMAGLTSNGTTTFHFSMRKDDCRPLNMSHEYQLVFVEPEGGTHVFEIKYGTGYQNSAEPIVVDPAVADQLRLMSSSVSGWDKMKVLFQTPFTPDVFHNFAVVIDWDRATIAAYYSQESQVLEQVVATTPNAVKLGGEFHVGMVKLPVGPTKNLVTDGFQEKGIRDTIIYGGVFVEDSANGVVTTEPFYM